MSAGRTYASRALAGALAAGAATLAAAIATAALAIALLGFPPGEALQALALGAFGDAAAWTATLLKTAPLVLTGLAVTLAFRCGAWNIGAEGQLLAGALGATFFATRVAPGGAAIWLLPATLLAGALAGALLAGLAAWLRTRRNVSEVIATILLNFVAIQLVAWAVQGPLQESSGAYPQSDALPAGARLPALGRVHAGVGLALLLAPLAAYGLFRTPLGFRLRAVGLSPLAARFAGIDPARHLAISLWMGGALAGLAGAGEVCGVTGRLYEGLSPGYGYTAIAVALLARLHPLAVLPAALLFGGLEAGAGAMQRTAGVPSVVTQVVQGLVVLLSIGVASGGLLRGRAAGAA